MLSSINLNLSEKLKNKEYRARFFRGQAQDEVAAQLKAARKKRHVTQPELEKISGMKQSAISRIEQSSYARWSFQTLLKIAEALDLRVRFVFEYAEDVISQYENIERDQDESRKPQMRRRHRRSGISRGSISGMSIIGTQRRQVVGSIGTRQQSFNFNQNIVGGIRVMAPPSEPTGANNSMLADLVCSKNGGDHYYGQYGA